jgi:hypothetical protein
MQAQICVRPETSTLDRTGQRQGQTPPDPHPTTAAAPSARVASKPRLPTPQPARPTGFLSPSNANHGSANRIPLGSRPDRGIGRPFAHPHGPKGRVRLLFGNGNGNGNGLGLGLRWAKQ